MSQVLQLHQVTALERFALNVTPPLLYERTDQQVVLLGTGTLFTLLDRWFVITANHLFDVPGIELERIGFPTDPVTGGTQTFGKFTLARPTDKRIDVAALELQEPSVISILQTNWQSLCLSNIANPMPSGRVFLGGYPGELVRQSAGSVHGRFVMIYSDPLDKPPDPDLLTSPAVPGLLFRYGREAEALDGTKVSTPKMPGTSGASVWQLQRVGDDALWSADRAARVIGVQCSYSPSHFFRAKNWRAVALLLQQIDQDLRSAIESHLATVQ